MMQKFCIGCILLCFWLGLLSPVYQVVGESSSANTKKIEEASNTTGNMTLDKEWIGRQRQILDLFNSIANCQVRKQVNFTVLDHLQEYANAAMVKNYVEGGFNDVEHLFEIFWHNWNNSELTYKTGIDLLNQNIDPVELYYGLASVVVNKPEGHRIPPAYDIFSEGILGPSEDEMQVDDITKAVNRKPGVDYYLEDPGLRSFYLSWFIHNPIWWKDNEYNVTKARTGELFLYVVHQLYARYTTARIMEGNLAELEDWKFQSEDQFANEIDSKLQEMVWQAGPEPNVKDPIDQVGKLILKLFPEKKNFFFELLNIAEMKSKTEKDLNNFYDILKYVETFAQGAREKLIQNPYTEADFHFDGVTLESFKIMYKSENNTVLRDNTIYTNWNYRKYYVKRCDKTVTTEKRILDHTEFFYELKIESLLDNVTSAVVDIFLSPKHDFNGKPILPIDYQKYMFHQDHFEILLKSGQNKFRRSSKISSLSSRGDRPYVKQIQHLLDIEAGYAQVPPPKGRKSRCGLPSNLMIPKGGENNRPHKFLVLALVTPATSAGRHHGPFTLCGDGSGKTSSRAFGFPFDRGLEPENLLEEVKNAKNIQVEGIMSVEDEFSEDL